MVAWRRGNRRSSSVGAGRRGEVAVGETSRLWLGQKWAPCMGDQRTLALLPPKMIGRGVPCRCRARGAPFAPPYQPEGALGVDTGCFPGERDTSRDSAWPVRTACTFRLTLSQDLLDCSPAGHPTLRPGRR